MGGVKVETFAGQLGDPERLFGHTGQDGVALGEEGVEGAAEAIVVELVNGDVPEDVGTGAVRPVRDLAEGGWTGKPGGQQQAEDLTVAIFQLGIGRQMAVDDLGNLQAFQQGDQQGQGSQIDNFFAACSSVPSEAHGGFSS